MKGFDEFGNALVEEPVQEQPTTEQVLAEHERLKAEQDAITKQYQGEGALKAQDRKPTVCRMVLFHTTEHDQKIYSQPAVLPAVVTFVNPDGSVNLTIFSDSHDNSYQKNVMQGPAPGQWDWPQY